MKPKLVFISKLKEVGRVYTKSELAAVARYTNLAADEMSSSLVDYERTPTDVRVLGEPATGSGVTIYVFSPMRISYS